MLRVAIGVSLIAEVLSGICWNLGTCSKYFEIDEEDNGIGDDDEVKGSRAAVAVKYRGLCERGKAKDEREDVPQVPVGLAETRRLPGRSLGASR